MRIKVTVPLLTGLYYNHKLTTNEEIAEILKRIDVFLVCEKKRNKKEIFLVANVFKKRLIERPRTTSLTFDSVTEDAPVTDFERRFPIRMDKIFLVRSNSEFFKPDIGEIIDQMSKEQKKRIKAIYFDSAEKLKKPLPNTEGRETLAKAVLCF